MPHLVHQNNTSILSSELWTTSYDFLGQEALVEDPSEAASNLRKLSGALGHLVMSPDEDVQIVRAGMDERYRVDTLGAPDDFAFRVEPGQSITEELSKLGHAQLLEFFRWNKERQQDMRQALLGTLPGLQENVIARAQLLVNHNLLPPFGGELFERAIGRIVSKSAIYPVDSFDGGVIQAMANANAIYFTHVFDGGYAIGKPTRMLERAAFHETGHVVRREVEEDKEPFDVEGVIEELLVEHLASISELDESHLLDTPLQASAEGHYNGLRRLFGLIIDAGPRHATREMVATAAVELDTPGTAYYGLLEVLIRNSAALFPEYGESEEPFYTLLQDIAYEQFVHVRHRVACDLAKEAEQRITGTQR